MSEWLHALRHAGERGIDAVLITVVSAKGSIPREAGARMVVTLEAMHGTIGGGELEFQAVDVARQLLRSPATKAAKRFPLGADLGQYCGGAADLFFERVSAAAEWVGVLSAWHEDGIDCVVATPANQARDGCLLVRVDTAWGNVGADAMDRRAIDFARGMLNDTVDAPEFAVLECGADAPERVLLERVRRNDFNVVLFGAGHVGRALVRVLGTLPCAVSWVDSRPDQFPARDAIPDNVRVVQTEEVAGHVDRAHAGSYFIVTTHSHALDFALVEAILRRGDFAYCGMIGSQTKRRTFENGLAKRGVPEASLARLTCPIGIGTLKGKAPATIAIAVAAQLLETRERISAA